ncbi:MAG: hypothetical protein QMC93_02810 [Patescibacteria group bacterium]|nr:hypothetical protein [Patescibacteria group bacterium]
MGKIFLIILIGLAVGFFIWKNISAPEVEKAPAAEEEEIGEGEISEEKEERIENGFTTMPFSTQRTSEVERMTIKIGFEG